MFAIIDICDTLEFGSVTNILVQMFVPWLVYYHRDTPKTPEKFNLHTKKMQYEITKYTRNSLSMLCSLSYSIPKATF